MTPSQLLERGIKQLQELRTDLMDSIDGGEECTGRDSQITVWIDQLDRAIAALAAARLEK